MKLLRKRQNMNGIILRNHKKAHELKKVIGLRGFVVAPPVERIFNSMYNSIIHSMKKLE
jgi:DNA-binding cell septation regulator SpoVG